MKRPLQLSLAIALALGGTHAMALGLGPVHVKSKLNQPLDAEIPVIQGTAGEAEGLLVSLAAAEDFERVGIARSHLSVPLEFSVGKGANGQPVIRVTSKEPVRDSYLDFLVEANWPKGRLLREYTVLLDPPVTAPARSAPATSVAAAPVAAPVEKPAPAPKREKEKAVAETAPAPAPERHEAKPAPAPAAAPRRIVEGEYGPTKEGETLSGIARAARADASVNIDQMMLALLKNNPNAFYKDNINALKRGAILRVPSADEVKAIGTASEAAAQVRSQIEDWRGGRAAAPTRVADAPAASAPAKSTAKTASASATKKSDERLELVPPKAGKDSIAMADQPGSGAGSASSGSAELKRELARTKETLTARDQETGELKSRVKELEDLKGKNDRLINLKDSEIADLQQKLKELQDKATAAKAAPAPTAATVAPPAGSKPAPAASTAATAASDKKDIWGDAGNKPAPAGDAKAPAADTHATAPTTAATGSAATPVKPDPASPSTGSTTPAAASASTPAGATATPASAPATAAPVAAPPPSATAPSGNAPATSAPGATASPGATVTPLPATPPTTASAPATPKTETKVPAAAPKKPAAPPKAVAGQPWYQAPWVMPAALGGGVLLVLAGLFGMRKRKAPAAAAGAARGSIADAFGDAPYSETQGATGVMDAEATALREQIEREPGNPGLYLELLSLYYAERDVARFEETAAEMHAHVSDPQQPEWQEAVAMGQELAPHNPLFAGTVEDAYHGAHDAVHHDPGYADTLRHPVLDDDGFGHAAHEPPAHATHRDTDYGFGLDAHAAHSAPHVPAPPADDSFTFDDLPPLEPVATRPAAMEPVPTMKDAPADDDFFSGDDAVGTKLDLAKAYLDMGDPDGARSMLEEVVAEGNDAQKAEAHRLIAELR